MIGNQTAALYVLIAGPTRFKVRSVGPMPLTDVGSGKAQGAEESTLLINEPIMCVERIEDDLIDVRPILYRDFIDGREQYGSRIRPLAVSGFIAEDEHLLVGRRPNTVTQYPGRLEAIPSGSIDCIEADGMVDPEAALLKELEEEAGLAPELAQLGLPFLVHDLTEHTFDICYPIHLSIALQEAAGRARRVAHYQDVRCERAAGLVEAGSDLVPTTMAIVDHLLRRGPFAGGGIEQE